MDMLETGFRKLVSIGAAFILWYLGLSHRTRQAWEVDMLGIWHKQVAGMRVLSFGAFLEHKAAPLWASTLSLQAPKVLVML